MISSYLYPCSLCAAVSTQGSFKVSSYLMKYVLPHWHALKRCASAPVDLGVCLCGCVCCAGAPLSAPNLYIIPPVTTSPSAGPARARPRGVNLLNEISAPLTRALVLSPFARRTGMTFDPRDLWAATAFLQAGTPQLQPTMPKPGRRSEEVRPWCVEDYRGVKWRVYFQKETSHVLEKDTPSLTKRKRKEF